MSEIRRTASYVVLTHDAAETLTSKAQRYERLALYLRDQLEEQHTMLIVALAQLAVEHGSKDREYFIRVWMKKYRAADDPNWLMRREPADNDS